MDIAYADPPYIGQAKKHYNSEEVDHELLIDTLCDYDGWALSASSPSLRKILSWCPPKVRVAAWVKPFASFKKNVNPAYAWEPVIFMPARKPNGDETLRDWIAEPITTQKGLVGAKPEAFCIWLFGILGMRIEDRLEDLFPGTGIVTDVWNKWRIRLF